MTPSWKKAVWVVLCGTTLGLGGCYESDPPADVGTDDDAADTVDTVETPGEDSVVTYYGPMPDL
jgi:hypothetical protein